MAKAAGLSHGTVGRIWRTFRLQPHRTESFKLAPDPQLIAKIRDVVGLSMTPPANAAVFSVDEKSQIQALQRAQPILPMDVGHPERRTHNYVRHGTLDLFAALNVATGEILARCRAQHRAQDVVAFLREIEASVDAALSPVAFAIARVLQCVSPGGVVSKVLTITAFLPAWRPAKITTTLPVFRLRIRFG